MESIKQIRIDYPDSDVQSRVKCFLFSRHFPAFRDLAVEVSNGTVTLTGSVNSYYEKQVALNSCRRVAGVLNMVDQLEVETYPGKKPIAPR